MIKVLRHFSRTKLTDAVQITQADVQDILSLLPQQSSSSTLTTLAKFIHGIPVINQPFPPLPKQASQSITPMTRLYKQLEMNGDTSFQEFAKKTCLFSDIYQEQHKVPVQKAKGSWSVINNQLSPPKIDQKTKKFLKTLHHFYVVNPSIPGCIQCQDPRTFIQLRPIQQFRHTPMIPIEDSAMKRHKEMLERYHSKAFGFSVNKESLLNYLLVLGAGVVMYFMFMKIIQKNNKTILEFERKRVERAQKSPISRADRR